MTGRMSLFIQARPHRYTTWPDKQATWAAEQEKNNTNTAGRKTSQHMSKEQCKYNGNG